jgi:hypothetical protein
MTKTMNMMMVLLKMKMREMKMATNMKLQPEKWEKISSLIKI